jgi:hypothetical protein
MTNRTERALDHSVISIAPLKWPQKLAMTLGLKPSQPALSHVHHSYKEDGSGIAEGGENKGGDAEDKEKKDEEGSYVENKSQDVNKHAEGGVTNKSGENEAVDKSKEGGDVNESGGDKGRDEDEWRMLRMRMRWEMSIVMCMGMGTGC